MENTALYRPGLTEPKDDSKEKKDRCQIHRLFFLRQTQGQHLDMKKIEISGLSAHPLASEWRFLSSSLGLGGRDRDRAHWRGAGVRSLRAAAENELISPSPRRYSLVLKSHSQ